MRILVVEDDASLADGLCIGLRLHGFVPELVGLCNRWSGNSLTP